MFIKIWSNTYSLYTEDFMNFRMVKGVKKITPSYISLTSYSVTRTNWKEITAMTGI